MPKGMSLHIGLNSIDPNVYGTSENLSRCENDANAMANIARQLKYIKVNLVLSKYAIRYSVINSIKSAAETLNEGDIFFLTYSGHGSTVKNTNGYEDDRKNETWCLYDGQLIADELYELLSSFKPNVRIIVLSDSCHSDTAFKEISYNLTKTTNENETEAFKFLPSQFSNFEYKNNKKKYNTIKKSPKENLSCTIKLISGCQYNQLSSDGSTNGLFTEKLLKVWNNGIFNKDYAVFLKAIVNQMTPKKTPSYLTLGKINPTFDNQKPFSI